MSTPTIKLVRVLRECPWNTKHANEPRKLFHDFDILINGELRAQAHRTDINRRSYTLNVPGIHESLSTPDDRYEDGRPRWQRRADTQACIEKEIRALLEQGAVPTLSEIEARKAQLEEQKLAADAEALRATILHQKKEAAEDLYEALRNLVDDIEGPGPINIVAAKAAIAKAEKRSL